MKTTFWSCNFCCLGMLKALGSNKWQFDHVIFVRFSQACPNVLWNNKSAIWILKKIWSISVFGFKWCTIAALVIFSKLYISLKNLVLKLWTKMLWANQLAGFFIFHISKSIWGINSYFASSYYTFLSDFSKWGIKLKVLSPLSSHTLFVVF